MDRSPHQNADLHELLDSTLVMMAGKIPSGVTVVKDYADTLPPVPSYAAELNQVWTNLIDNALDAMDGQGTLTIRTHNDDDHATVQISDTGLGIPDEDKERIFEPFFTTKPIGHGTGLGLDIAWRIVVNKHRGYLKVTSVPGPRHSRSASARGSRDRGHAMSVKRDRSLCPSYRKRVCAAGRGWVGRRVGRDIGRPTDPRRRLRWARRTGRAGRRNASHAEARRGLGADRLGGLVKIVPEMLEHSPTASLPTSTAISTSSSSVKQPTRLGEAFNGERRYCSRRSPGPARSYREPLTCGSVVGLAGFEPATP